MRTPSVLLLALASLAGGQQIVDVPLGTSLPVFAGPTFAGDTSVSVATLAGGGAIHTWTGLPGNPVSVVLPLAGPLAMTAEWTRLDDRTAAYDAAGGTVALVYGLPETPQVSATSFAGPSAALIAVNGTTAVRVSAAGFHVLRHAPSGSTSAFVPSPGILSTAAWNRGGAADAETFFALGTGPDALPNTADDRLVRLDGLGGAGLASLAVSSVPFPHPWAPEGFLVAPSGGAVVWRRSGLGTFDLSVIQVAGTGVVFLPMSVTTPAPFGFWNLGSWNYSAGVVAPDGVRFRHDDDVGFGNVLIGNLHGTPGIVQSWFDDPFNAYVSSQVLNDRDLVFLDSVTLTGFSYTRWTDGVPESYAAGEPYNWAGIDFVVPDHRVIAAFFQVWSATAIGQQDATLTIERQLPAGNSTVSFDVPDASWFGRFFSMGPGRVAGFLHLNSPGSGAADRLRICSYAVASGHEVSGGWHAPATVALSFQPPIPSLAAPLTVQVAVPGPAPASAFLGVALARVSPVFLAPYDAVLHLDPAGLFVLLPLTVSGGSGAIVIGGGLPPALAGIPFFIQAVAAAGAQVRLSDLGVVVYGL